ncbi:MAG: DUF4011 domain-containing protein [Bacteroidaceae bacterium]|nr:DUF4011 domain-containing protein [Bacteroidaceae bacterium]
MTRNSLLSCLKQAEQLEQEVQSLELTAGERVRLSALLRTAKESLAEVEKIVMPALGEEQETAAKLRLWERKLLDLSLRNNLLNMRMGRNALPYEHDNIALLEDELDQGKEFVLEKPELKGIYRAVRTNMEESGVNTLFLTLGTLVWNERAGGRKYSAPIMLMPVSIVSMKKGAFAIRKRDEDVMLNVTLMEFLKQQYDIDVEGVSPLPQDAHGIDVSLVLHLVREAVKEQTEWEVCEDSVLGIFSFAKFVMWNDIHTHSDIVMQNPITRSLVEGRLVIDNGQLTMDNGTESMDARQMDTHMRPDEIAVTVDADSSQLEAVVESVRGRSFVLYGPPGTGKSQTITNLISNALYNGKRVLFVAEKKAALEVVQSRLAKIGLAPFCLELHSNKMDKQHFLHQMQTAIESFGATHPSDFRATADSLFNQRMQLFGYVDALHRKQPIGMSLYDCINRFLSIDAQPLQLPNGFTKGITMQAIEDYCMQIKSLDSGRSILGMEPAEHPLRGLIPIARQPEKKAYSMAAETLEKALPALPQTIQAISKQIERGQAMKFISKTTRQYLEADYKWKKFTALASVSDSLLDDINALTEAADRWSKAVDLLPAWEKYSSIAANLKTVGLGEAVNAYNAGRSTEDICDAFIAACYRQLVMDTIQSDPALSMFNSLQFEQIIQKYNTLTRAFQQLTRQELVARISAHHPLGEGNDGAAHDPQLSSELTLLRKRIANKGRGTSIRNIIEQMPTLLPRLCPVMLMSPLSVAQYIDINAPQFDLVVFDEASQMPTSEAVGAICRAKAAIIVGDPKQMPPTSFFSANATDDDEAAIDDLESILDDCISLSMPARYLGWHYRSQHESLIAFSNHNYYDGRLVTFPSADDIVSHVTWRHVDGYYDFGGTRTNRAEAEAIVAEAIARMQSEPMRSIGIVAFSKQQSDLIEDLLNEALASQPELDAQNRDSSEPLFVKNLENVQGDERDTILFSIGYGPDKEGRVSMNFGPLNKAGGERRLNVAVSRARYDMVVFSTLKPEQIDERRTQAEGVLGLKQFLKYAQSQSLLSLHPSDSNGEDVSRKAMIVNQLCQALQQRGYRVHTDIGTSAFRVDVAIEDPVNPQQYKLGILCDGERYRQLKTVRDREVVCTAVLHHLGWRLMHLWTLDWFLNPDAVVENILQQLQAN